MNFDADLIACAGLVEKADADRFAAAMASPPAVRPTLFALYAFNVEVSRAPWLTREPMIAEMRLQWWRDALEEITSQSQVRRHEVVTPLSRFLDAEGAQLLDASVEARRWDIYSDAFEDEAHFHSYITRTSGNLMWVAARSLAAEAIHRDAILDIGYATGLARYLQAVPILEAQSRIPLLDGRPEAIAALADAARAKFRAALRALKDLRKPARCALTEAWQTEALLTRVIRAPHRVADGSLSLFPLHRSLLLWRMS